MTWGWWWLEVCEHPKDFDLDYAAWYIADQQPLAFLTRVEPKVQTGYKYKHQDSFNTKVYEGISFTSTSNKHSPEFLYFSWKWNFATKTNIYNRCNWWCVEFLKIGKCMDSSDCDRYHRMSGLIEEIWALRCIWYRRSVNFDILYFSYLFPSCVQF